MQNTDPTKPNYVARTPDAVEAKRKPVAAKRSQDASTTSNDGKTIVKEGGAQAMGNPKGGTQPAQPNPSSLRQ